MNLRVQRRGRAKADMCARADLPTLTVQALWLLALLLLASLATSCLGPGLEPPDGDNAAGGPRGEAGAPPTGGSGASAGMGAGGAAGNPTSGGGTGGQVPGAGGASGDAGDGGDSGETVEDAGVDDEDAGALEL